MFLSLDCGGSVFGPCFVMHYLSVISSLQSSWGRESWLLYFNCLPCVLWLLVFCGSSSWCRGLVCSEWLCYFLIILIYLLQQFILRRYYATALRNVSFQCLTSGFMQLASGFMQLAATCCSRIILHFHCLFVGKCYLCIRMGITILKIIILGGISFRCHVLAPLTRHQKIKFSFHISNDIPHQMRNFKYSYPLNVFLIIIYLFIFTMTPQDPTFVGSF